MLKAALFLAISTLIVSSVRAQLQPDSCGRDGLPCCPGDDAVGNRCQINCSFTICTGVGYDAFCEVPVEGDPDIGDAPTICKGCGVRGQKCCADTAVGEVGSCGSRAGRAVCAEVDGEDTPMCVACGDEGDRCCGTGCGGVGLECIRGICKKPAPQVAALWEQCGGRGFKGPKACSPGNKCKRRNRWYFQCVPDPKAIADGPRLWEQCGGKGFKGKTTCAFGNRCVEHNAYYSQCEP